MLNRVYEAGRDLGRKAILGGALMATGFVTCFSSSIYHHLRNPLFTPVVAKRHDKLYVGLIQAYQERTALSNKFGKLSEKEQERLLELERIIPEIEAEQADISLNPEFLKYQENKKKDIEEELRLLRRDSVPGGVLALAGLTGILLLQKEEEN